MSSLLLPLLSLLLVLNPLPSQTKSDEQIGWIGGTLNSALTASATSGKQVLVYCWKDKDEACVTMFDYTMQVDSVVGEMKKWICLSAKQGTAEGDEVFQKFEVRAVPTVLFLTTQGELIDVVGGAMQPTQLAFELERIGRGENTLRELLVQEANADDKRHLEAIFDLAFRFRKLGDTEKSESRLARLRELDTKLTSLPGSRAHLIHVAGEMARKIDDPTFRYDWDGRQFQVLGDIRAWELKPLMDITRKIKHPEAKFETWDMLGRFQMKRENRQAALASWQQAHKTVPDMRAVDWCSELANMIMNYPYKRTPQDSKFALKLATHSAKLAKDLDASTEEFAAYFPKQTVNQVLARQLETFGFALKFNGQHSKSLETLQRCVELDPENEKYQKSFELVKSGNWPPPPKEQEK